MKVIFLKDVPNVAKSGDIKDVADGYARNFLLPRNLAMLADASGKRFIESQRQTEAKTESEMQELAKQLDGKEITLKARVGNEERLHGSITSANIADELQKSAGVDIDKRKIELTEPIHSLGSYEVILRLGKDITPKVKVNVVEEK